MNDPVVDAVLFDYGGVIAEEGFIKGLARIAEKNGIEREYFFDVATDQVYKTGYLTGQADEAAFWQAVREITGIRESDRVLTDEILSHFTLRSWVLDLADDLRNLGLTVGILSDQVDWLDRLDKRDGFFEHFDPVFNSYYLGLSKRAEAIFEEIPRRMGLAAERICFIDDNQGNCERARKNNIKAILYRTGNGMLLDLKGYVPALDPSRYDLESD